MGERHLLNNPREWTCVMHEMPEFWKLGEWLQDTAEESDENECHWDEESCGLDVGCEGGEELAEGRDPCFEHYLDVVN